MPKDTSHDKTAFEAFQRAFLSGQSRVQAAWQEACRAHPIAGEGETPRRVTASLLKEQASAKSQRTARLHSALEQSCAELWRSDYLVHNSAARSLRQAVNLLRKEWQRGRDEFLAEVASEFQSAFDRTPTSTPASRRQQDDVILLENEVWFLAGFAEAIAVAHDLSPYVLPKDRVKNRKALLKTLVELQVFLPAALLDDMFLNTLSPDLVVALQTVSQYGAGIRDLASRTSGKGEDRIDAAVRDKQGDSYLGARTHDVINQIVRACHETFGCCPKDALHLLIGGLVPADSAVGNDQVEHFVRLAVELHNKAEKRRQALVMSTTANSNPSMLPRLWVFGQPKPLPRT